MIKLNLIIKGKNVLFSKQKKKKYKNKLSVRRVYVHFTAAVSRENILFFLKIVVRIILLVSVSDVVWIVKFT